jgi:hypothetical protein
VTHAFLELFAQNWISKIRLLNCCHDGVFSLNSETLSFSSEDYG